jgi:hypothetical protein
MTDLAYDHTRADTPAHCEKTRPCRLIKREIIDAVIGRLTNTLRARWSRLSLSAPCAECEAATEYFDALQNSAKSALAESGRSARDAEMQARSKQSEVAQKSRLKTILAAARFYRGEGMTAADAWDTIGKTPVAMPDGRVAIDKHKPRDKQRMRVISRRGRQSAEIMYDTFRKKLLDGCRQAGLSAKAFLST